MAYTGTGTQEDPYIPETLHDFIEVINITDAYVKVTHDIDGNDDPLGGEINSSIAFNCKECAGEKPGGRPIIKNIVQVFLGNSGDSFWFNGSVILKDLIFYNIECKNINSFLYTNSGNSRYASIKNINFSVRIIPSSNATFYFCSFCNLTDCGLNLTFKNNIVNQFSSQNYYYLANFIRTNIVIKNLATKQIELSGINFIRSAMIFDSLNFSPNSYDAVLCYKGNYSYFTFINSNGLTKQFKSYSDSSVTLICFDNSNYELTAPSFIEITPENLKDKQYLIDLGFLP